MQFIFSVMILFCMYEPCFYNIFTDFFFSPGSATTLELRLSGEQNAITAPRCENMKV